ncbi:MAG: GxxExxY protein [Bacteroidetes bacterium]|nr:GxxExxY protein [Bacteroidota bacterium]
METESTARAIVDAAYRVHSALGPGLLESTYERVLSYELRTRGMKVETQIPVSVQYRDLFVPCGYRLDMLIHECVIVEVKAVEQTLPVHRAQLLTYLKLTSLRLGLLINFNVPLIKSGIKRIIL